VAAGPRGRQDRRFQTRAYPIRAEVGPYEVVGYFHTLPAAEPLGVALAREVIALRPARVAYRLADKSVEERHDVLLIMRRKLRRFESATDEEVGLGRPSAL
jgi:hypothetical protein